MREYLQIVLKNIDKILYQKRAKELNPLFVLIIMEALAVIADCIFIDNFSSRSFLEKTFVLFFTFFLVLIAAVPVYCSIEYFRKKNIDKVIIDVRRTSNELFTASNDPSLAINNPEITPASDKLLSKEGSELSFTAFDPSHMSLNQLRKLVKHIRTFLPSTEINEEADVESNVSLKKNL